MMPVKLILGDPDGLFEIMVRQLRVEHRMPVLGQKGRLHTARSRLLAVEEEDGHGSLGADRPCQGSGAVVTGVSRVPAPSVSIRPFPILIDV